MLRKRTTGPGVSGPTSRSERPVKEKVWPEWRITPTRLSRAVIELALEHRRIAHRPTVAQMRTMAGFDGRAPSTYPTAIKLEAVTAEERAPASA
jgi:hypothetical protein